MSTGKNVSCDVLIVGAGLTAMRAASRTAEAGLTTVMAFVGSGASPHVLGFNAVRESGAYNDSTERLYDDMIRAGRYLNSPQVVRSYVNGAHCLLSDLEKIGYIPDLDESGEPFRRHLGGNSVPRTFFSGDNTGGAILEKLKAHLEKLGVIMLPGVTITAPVLHFGEVVGALGFDKCGNSVAIRAGTVISAGGGLGSLYKGSTYPTDVCASSAAFCLLAGAELTDMEFIQFEPTVCFSHVAIDRMEMPTAMLGAGAALRNIRGERFIEKYGYEKEAGLEKAILSRLIAEEMRRTKHDCVYFDAKSLSVNELEKYAIRVARLKKAGIDLKLDMVPVRPAAHSHMGGVKIDGMCKTAVPGLLCAGEAAGSLHGASRIAGNGGGEALITGALAGDTAVALGRQLISPQLFEKAVFDSLARYGSLPSFSAQDIKRAGELLGTGAKLIRTKDTLLSALDAIHMSGDATREDTTDRSATRFAKIKICECILNSAYLRCESRGAHIRSDYPNETEQWRVNLNYSVLESGILKMVKYLYSK